MGSVSLAAIATAMASAATIITATSSLFQFVGDLMETVEKAYAAVPNSGATKKGMVLAGLSAIATALSIDFTPLVAQFSAWIDTVKTAYNSAVNAFKPQPAAPAVPVLGSLAQQGA